MVLKRLTELKQGVKVGMKFTPVKRLPKFDLVDKNGYQRSQPVLGLSVDNGQGVVFAVKPDKEDPDKVIWLTQCQNEYDVTDYLLGWQYLPKPLLKK
jgi:hypothetical protein